MNKYTIYCTPEQTRKALGIGASLQFLGYRDCTGWDNEPVHKNSICVNSKFYEIPTAEQMIGWLEEQGLCIEPYRTACGYLCTMSKVPTGSQIYSQEFEGDNKESGHFTTRAKATLEAIDYALDYLLTQKQ